MIYDAIINGARSLAFYGGNNPDCWNPTDTQHIGAGRSGTRRCEA